MKQLLLPNIRSAQNVGTIFRTAEAFGVDQIILSGYTPQPIDRFGRDRSDIAKAALGAEKMVLWSFEENIIEYLLGKKKEGFKIIGLEQEKNSEDLGGYSYGGENIILVVGNEIDGIDQEIREVVDTFVEIPMQGQKESLNVAVATGIMLWKFFGK